MMELGSVNRLFFEKKLEFLGIPKFFYGKSCFMKLEKLRSVSFPQILGVRHPRILARNLWVATEEVQLKFVFFSQKILLSRRNRRTRTPSEQNSFFYPLVLFP